MITNCFGVFQRLWSIVKNVFNHKTSGNQQKQLFLRRPWVNIVIFVH